MLMALFSRSFLASVVGGVAIVAVDNGSTWHNCTAGINAGADTVTCDNGSTPAFNGTTVASASNLIVVLTDSRPQLGDPDGGGGHPATAERSALRDVTGRRHRVGGGRLVLLRA